jgi:hypothetical protein
VGATVGSVDAIDVGVQVFRVFAGILQGDLDLHVVRNGLVIDDLAVDGVAGPVEVLDVFDDPPLVAEFLGRVDPLVDELDANAAVEEGEFAEAALEDVVLELCGGKDIAVGLEGDFRPPELRRPHPLEGPQRDAGFKLLLVHGSVATDGGFAPAAEEVDRLEADSVEAAGSFVALLVELGPHVEVGHGGFERADVPSLFGGHLLVLFDGNAAAVVLDADGAVVVDGDGNQRGKAGHRLVDGVVDELVDKVVESLDGAIADVHAVAFADMLPVGELFKLVGRVIVGGDAVIAVAAGGRTVSVRAFGQGGIGGNGFERGLFESIFRHGVLVSVLRWEQVSLLAKQPTRGCRL